MSFRCYYLSIYKMLTEVGLNWKKKNYVMCYPWFPSYIQENYSGLNTMLLFIIHKLWIFYYYLFNFLFFNPNPLDFFEYLCMFIVKSFLRLFYLLYVNKFLLDTMQWSSVLSANCLFKWTLLDKHWIIYGSST